MDGTQKFHTVRGYQLLEQNRKTLTSAMEDYLEMIYRQSLEKQYVRINMLAERLNVAAPSATKMMRKLKELGLIDYQKYGIVVLTENGKEIGAFLFQRHYIIETFLKNLGVSESLLIETELIEHSFTAATLQRISAFNRFLEQNPEIISRFEKFAQFHD